MAASTIVRTNVNLTDDSGSGADGTVFNAAWATAFMDAIDDFWDGTTNPLQLEGAVATLAFVINNTNADGDAVLGFENAGTRIITMGFDDGDGDIFKISTTAIGTNTRLAIDTSGGVFINDTANAAMTIGLTVKVGATDTQVVDLKGSISSGMTTLPLSAFDVEVDDFYTVGQIATATGGAHVVVVAETTEAVSYHHEVWGGSPATTDTSSSLGAVNWFVGEHDGSNADADMAADSNAFVWGEIDSSGARVSRMLLKADDGELHLGNTTIAQLDEETDIDLVRAFQFESSGGVGMLPKPWATSDYGVPTFSHKRLMDVGVLGAKDAEGHCFMRVQPTFALCLGAIWQNYTTIEVNSRMVDTRMTSLESRLHLLEA